MKRKRAEAGGPAARWESHLWKDHVAQSIPIRRLRNVAYRRTPGRRPSFRAALHADERSLLDARRFAATPSRWNCVTSAHR
jgi:hypothetical protein